MYRESFVRGRAYKNNVIIVRQSFSINLVTLDSLITSYVEVRRYTLPSV